MGWRSVVYIICVLARGVSRDQLVSVLSVMHYKKINT